MKKRNGFVSNSSSSSFVCDVCGAETSGWDMCLSDAYMFECENGHEVCESHILPEGKSYGEISEDEDFDWESAMEASLEDFDPRSKK